MSMPFSTKTFLCHTLLCFSLQILFSVEKRLIIHVKFCLAMPIKMFFSFELRNRSVKTQNIIVGLIDFLNEGYDEYILISSA